MDGGPTPSGLGKKRARSPGDFAHDNTLTVPGDINPLSPPSPRRRRLAKERAYEQIDLASFDAQPARAVVMMPLGVSKSVFCSTSRSESPTEASTALPPLEGLDGFVVKNGGLAMAQSSPHELSEISERSDADDDTEEPAVTLGVRVKRKRLSNYSSRSGYSAKSAPAQLQTRDPSPPAANEQRESRGCGNCRRLEIKCVFLAGWNECERCRDTSMSCTFDYGKPRSKQHEILMREIAEKERIIQSLLRRMYTREEPPEGSNHVNTVTSFMTVSQVIACLADRGCANITTQLEEESYSTYPVCHGGFGDIYQGCLKDGTKVAIKAMRLQVSCDEDRTPLKHAARELYAWSKCQHKNVHCLLGLIEFRGQIGMVSTWEVNGNLNNYLRLHPGVNRRSLIVQVVAGLSYLHQNNVVHGDLKACNILVSKDGVPLLSDFGNATLLEYTLKFTNSSTKIAISTRWAAPEILDGASQYSIEGDVYALGMTILEIVTGNVPWFGKGESAIALSVFVKKEHPQRPLECVPKDCQYSNTLWFLLEACWSYEPAARPSAADVQIRIQNITNEATITVAANLSDTGAMAVPEIIVGGISSQAEGGLSVSVKSDEQAIESPTAKGSVFIDQDKHGIVEGKHALQDSSSPDDLLAPGRDANLQNGGSSCVPNYTVCGDEP